MSIFLEAIQRFVEPQEVKNPKLVLVVGCLGLASNIVGLVLFHDHSHGHGHGHGHVEVEDEEHGRVVSDTAAISDENAPPASVLPQGALEGYESNAVRHVAGSESPRRPNLGRAYSRRRGSRRMSMSRGYRDVDEIYTHPATLRQDIIDASRFEDDELEEDAEEDTLDGNTQPSERAPLLKQGGRNKGYSSGDSGSTKGDTHDLHHTHNHAQPKTDKKASGHSHDLNMRGVFLHVLGDALGNIGVISSALIIWLTEYSWRYYFDPGISLIITVIILWSAIPLCKAASRILLQAAPAGMSVDHIIEDIESLPGVLSCHHLHVWQLSNTNLVSSLHIQVSHDIKGEGSDRYMELARQVRLCLHAYGIHSSTIQPEFAPSSDSESVVSSSGVQPSTGVAGTLSPHTGDDSPCLLECGNECAPGGQCCPSR